MALQISRFATCSFVDCQSPGVRGRSCSTCQQHLCALHQIANHHQCLTSPPSPIDDDTWDRLLDEEVQALLSLVNIPELLAVASGLRGGMACQFEPGKHRGDGALMGCANYHAFLHFEDGASWIVRIPRTTGFDDVPSRLVEYLVASEFATLKFLETATIPSPKVFGFGIQSDISNTVGTSYILMEKLPGSPYYQSVATQSQRHHVLDQLATILQELSNHPFSKAGSLLLDGGELRVSSIAGDRFLRLGDPGPYDTHHDYFHQIADQHLDLIAEGQLFHTYPKLAYTFYRILRDEAAPVLSLLCEPGNSFYLKHVDDKGDHILVDTHYNITGIIDWQFARTVPPCEAFGPSLVTADLSRLYSSDSGPSEEDVYLAGALSCRTELVQYAQANELARRFHLGPASRLTRAECVELLDGLVRLLPNLAPLPESDLDREKWLRERWKVFEIDDTERWSRVEKMARLSE